MKVIELVQQLKPLYPHLLSQFCCGILSNCFMCTCERQPARTEIVNRKLKAVIWRNS